jgi:hypothetical protein
MACFLECRPRKGQQMNTTNHTSPSGEDAANGAIGEREAWEQLRGLLAVAMCSFATKVGRKDLDAAVSVLDAITEPGSPMAWLRAALTAEKVAAEPIYQAMATDDDPNNSAVWMDVEVRAFESMKKRTDVRTRIVYATPQPAQTQVALTQEHIRKIAEEHFWGGKCTTADDLEKAIVAALREASLAAQPVSGGKS